MKNNNYTKFIENSSEFVRGLGRKSICDIK